MKPAGRLVVNAIWDDEVRVWVATSEDVPGLATEADDMDTLVEKLKLMIPEFLDANGVEHAPDVPFVVMGRESRLATRQTQC